MKTILLSLTPSLLALTLSAAPLQPADLQPRATMNFGVDYGKSATIYNPVCFGGHVYVNQINSPGFGRYDSGWETPLLLVTNATEHRMVKPFPGALSSTYIVAASAGLSGATTTTFTRYNYDGTDPVAANTPSGVIAEGFDWADDTTIIHTSYTSGSRNRLYLVKVTAEPFALEADTRWGASGSVLTAATVRIRNVRTGDVYKDYAYFGDAGVANDPKFYAIHIPTGALTEMGGFGPVTGTGSWGLWTVIERGGYLYVHTTDNGIQIYNMNSATSLGSLLTSYSKADLDAATSVSTQYWGFDVVPDGSRFILAGTGKCFEIGAPQVLLAADPANATLMWPGSVVAVTVQSAPSPGSFTDMDPQPPVYLDAAGKTNSAMIPMATGNTFFRLRKN